MKTLSNNWLTEGLIDFEYKKYVLLAYLQDVKTYFGEEKLYPFLQDLVFHYQNIIMLKENKQLIKEQFPERISGPDFNKFKIVYEKIVEDDEVMSEIEEIISFSVPEIQKQLEEGKKLYEYFESQMEIYPVGLLPIYSDEGYFFISEHNKKETKVYEYQLSIIQNANENYRGIYTRHLETRRKNLSIRYESIKIELIKTYKKLPNPATFVIHTNINCPLDESLLPIAKRLLVKHVTSTRL